MAPLNFRYTQVGFNLISVQVTAQRSTEQDHSLYATPARCALQTLQLLVYAMWGIYSTLGPAGGGFAAGSSSAAALPVTAFTNSA